MARCPIQCLLVLAAACPFAACTPSVEPIFVRTGCPSGPLRGPAAYANAPEDLLISDFESGTKQLARVGGRDGYWVWGSTDWPPLTKEKETGRVDANTCAAAGKYAGHLWAGGYDWSADGLVGVNWTAIFRNDETDGSSSAPKPYNAETYGYTGISFWAGLGGSNPAPFPVRFGVTTMNTAWNSTACSDRCQDFYATRVTLSYRWERYVIKFDDMKQAGWGKIQEDLPRSQLVGFIIWPEQTFDIWIDDIRFER